MSARYWIMLGALLAAAAVLTGAFGAHGLKPRLKAGEITADQFDAFETAARNQMTHAIALILVGLVVAAKGSSLCSQIAGCAFLLGIVLFCGWLYANALTGNVGWPFLVPIGGVSLVVGWIAVAVAGWRWSPIVR
jgi:uncharacterized membrane protein YgdD (TMEM256/DUF423 family)